MIAIGTLLAVLTVTLIVNRVGTIALTATGLSTEVAHFQARAALTGVGFTTSESELVVNHPVRRRIVLTLMLVGNAGLVTIIATVVVGFAGQGHSSEVPLKVATLLGGLLVISLKTLSGFEDHVGGIGGTVKALDRFRRHTARQLKIRLECVLIQRVDLESHGNCLGSQAPVQFKIPGGANQRF